MKIKKDETLKLVSCEFCDKDMWVEIWIVEKYKKYEESHYCSSECEYEDETGFPGEQY